MKTLNRLKSILFSLVLISFFGCNNSESGNGSLEQPTISVRLVDAPGDYATVNVEVVDVMIKMDNDNEDNNGWMSLNAESGPINLLDFTGGISKVLVDRFAIPAGTLSQMRLVLGGGEQDNYIEIENDNSSLDREYLKTPSAQQSGLKLKVDALIEEGFTYDFVLDFDVDKSIVHAGNSGNVILKPVMYVSAEVNSGIIQGTVTPSDVPSMATVLVDDMGDEDPANDFVISAYTDDTGAFALWGVPAGTYDVMIVPTESESDYQGESVLGVIVFNGEITPIADSITLVLKPGSISGTISGLAENIVATISINDANSTNVETNIEGAYVIENVAPGDYTVIISAEGYLTQNIDVTIDPDEDEILDAILDLIP